MDNKLLAKVLDFVEQVIEINIDRGVEPSEAEFLLLEIANTHKESAISATIAMHNHDMDTSTLIEKKEDYVKYGVSKEQFKNITALCDVLNDEQLKGSGICAVPFWFYKHTEDLLKTNAALANETENLMSSINHLRKVDPQELIDLPSRDSLVTGNKTIYVPGVTGPRKGDEHLDMEQYRYRPFKK